MGHSTSYIGRLDIVPPLNPAETEWLLAFRVTERAFHPMIRMPCPRTPEASFTTIPSVGCPAAVGRSRPAPARVCRAAIGSPASRAVASCGSASRSPTPCSRN